MIFRKYKNYVNYKLNVYLKVYKDINMIRLLFYSFGLHSVNLLKCSNSSLVSLSDISSEYRKRLCTLGALRWIFASFWYQLSHICLLTLCPKTCFILIISLNSTNWYLFNRCFVVVKADILSTTGWFAMLEEPRPSLCRIVSAERSWLSSDICICFDTRTFACVWRSCSMILVLTSDDGPKVWTSLISFNVVKDTEVRSPRSMAAMCDEASNCDDTMPIVIIIFLSHTNNLVWVLID